MTQVQLESLSEDERDMLFYIVNIISPTTSPTIQYDMHTIKWMRHEQLINKILNSINSITKDAHPICSELLAKLGINIQIKYNAPPTASATPNDIGSLCQPTVTDNNTTSGSGMSPENIPHVPDVDSNTDATKDSSV